MKTITENNQLNTSSDYKYPSLNRKDLMYLSTLTSFDAPMKKFKQIDTRRNWSINLYNLDIEGTSPKRFGVFNHKIDYINKLDDIERTSSKLRHVHLNKPEYNLDNRDISGSSPRCGTLITTRQCNPLEPKYQLPKVEEIPQPIPKFLRDSIKIDDIDGAHPRKYFKWNTRPIMVNDVDGCTTKKSYVRKTKFNSIDYSDVTHDIFKTRRCVNPLDPIYEVRYKNGETYIHGNIPKSKPQTFSSYIYPDPFNMKIEDIDGTQVGSKNRISRFTGQNFNIITNDIRGTSAGSLKKGISTSRSTNPLDPKYLVPGHKELVGKNNNPYGETIEATAPRKVLDIRAKKEEEGFVMKEGKENIPQGGGGRVQERGNRNQNEVLGFNNQLYYEDHIDFDAEKFKKPDPYYGFLHDKYLISTEKHYKKRDAGKLKQGSSEGINSNSSGIGNTNINSTNFKGTSNPLGKSITDTDSRKKSQTFTDSLFPKQSYAQQLDKFMLENNLKYQN